MYDLSRIAPSCILVGLSLALLLVAPGSLHAQAAAIAPADHATSGDLYDELARMDSLLFDAGFVRCEADRVNALVSEDIEFYHDQTGQRTGDEVREDFRVLTANCPRNNGVSRVLVDGTLEVYPIHEYGAVQTGMHRFVQEGSPGGTIAKFVHLWRRTDRGWILTRVLSFDHRQEQ